MTEFEGRIAEVLHQVKECESIHTKGFDLGPLALYMERAEDAFNIVKIVDSQPLPADLTKNFHRYSRVSVAWRARGPFHATAGEFALAHIGEVLIRGFKGEPAASTASSQERLVHEFRPFDSTPVGGTGTYSALRLTGAADSSELWYFDLRQGPTRLEINYGDYLEALLRTKGLYYWQYLYAQPDPKNYGMRVSLPYLRDGLAFLERAFPDDDLSDLRARLEERLHATSGRSAAKCDE
jgi:hypothetical protein